MDSVSRFRLYPTPAQRLALLEQCRDARNVWNLALEQWSMWSHDKPPTPGYVEQARQLTEQRCGSQVPGEPSVSYRRTFRADRVSV